MSSATLCAEPEITFESFALGARIQRGISAAGFTTPRPIQALTIAACLEGRDILGLAQTGTGKTAAFSLPILEKLLAVGREPSGAPRVLILAPTRELALQITDEIRTLARYTNIKVATLIGGVPVGPQMRALRARPEIVVACPGRLLDLHQQGIVRLNRINAVVVDEADHMLDMGFLPDVRRILDALPSRRQNLLFSATMPTEIRSFAQKLLHDPHTVEVEHTKAVELIEQALFAVQEQDKLRLLEGLIADDSFESAIVFTRTKYRAERLAKKLARASHAAVALQGNMSQNQRQRAMEGFRRRRFNILVATDIAARGIDVAGVSHVVNYDMPNTVDAYTHRIGRTGRSECEGTAFTFATADDRAQVRAVEKRLGEPIPRRSLEGVATIPLQTQSPSTPRPAPAGDRRRKSPKRSRKRASNAVSSPSSNPSPTPNSRSGKRSARRRRRRGPVTGG